ncbi:phosducin-like [Polyodon spathula]|uniref:phosducin-like n=1 Tax=Polyodon spathula TaxID=7913 RepID=UPI001B7E5CC3|nr:phosducin-like [Polyodon spathula]XP_041133308.1 phosducin-like [Polyodon spathula]
MSGNSVDEELDELPATNTGPKGVINDWRKFKLESENHESIPPSKRELLRQMSSSYQSNSKEETDIQRRLNRKMSVQEYELLQDEDEGCLHKYRKQCMQDMHQRLSFGPKFGCLYELESGEQFLDVIEKEHRLTMVVVHIYDDKVKGCDALNNCLTCLSMEYPTVKFCKIKASDTGAGNRFSDSVLPALLVYKAGDLVGNFLSISEQLNEEFFAVDVESFLNEYGLLPEKEFGACQNAQEVVE